MVLQVIRTWIAWLFVCLLGMTSLLVRADLPVFPHAEKVSQVSVKADDHLVLLGPVKAVNNELRLDKSVRLATQGHAALYQAGAGYDTQAVFEHYQVQINAREGRILYQCQGRECGESNLWANRMFGQSVLYGSDRNQRYLVAVQRSAQDEPEVIVLYVNERGNKQVMAWLEVLPVAVDGLPVALRARERSLLGPIVIDWQLGNPIKLQMTDAQLQDIDALSRRYPDSQIYLVGHARPSPEDRDLAFSRASDATQQLSAVLQQRGITQDRLSILVAGPLIPEHDADRSDNRVEILFLRTLGTAP